MTTLTVTLRQPNDADGPALFDLVARCAPLDHNSRYCNLLQCSDFADTGIAAVDEQHRLVGFISGYCPPQRPDTLFVWQVAVDPACRGQGLALRMLTALVKRCARERDIRFLETTITPSNHASQALFQRLFTQLQAPVSSHVRFARHPHFAGENEDEVIYRAGPFSTDLTCTEELL